MHTSHDNQPRSHSKRGTLAQVQGEPGLPDAYSWNLLSREPLSREQAVSAASFSLPGDHGLLAHHTWGG